MESLDQLDRYSSEELEQWLIHRLLAQYSADPRTRYKAFDLRHIGIHFDESHIDSLSQLFRLLSPQAQQRFRIAVELLMRHSQPETFPAKAMADLILLVGRTRAINALAAFAPIFGSGPWGELYGFLVYNALGVLMTFERTSEAYVAARALASSIHFPDAYALDAYMIMVRTRPEGWLRDWRSVRLRVYQFREMVKASGDEVRRWSLQEAYREFFPAIARSVPLYEFAIQLPHMDLRPPENRPSSDYWLLDGLLCSEGPLALEWDQDGTLRLFDRAAPARTELIASSTELEVVCMERGFVANPKMDELEECVLASTA